MTLHQVRIALAAGVLGASLLTVPATAGVIEGESRVSAMTSAGIAYGVLGVGVALVALLLADAATRQKKLAAQARASVSEEPPLRRGRAVLSGGGIL